MQVLKKLIILPFLFLVFFVCAQQKPNVLFISVDDMNDWIGCLNGHPQAHTPNIDKLAKQGVLFTNAHCAAPACNPSRAAVFTGKMPNTTNIWSNTSGGVGQVSPNSVLITQRFREAGYKVLGTGKLIGRGDKTIFDEYYGPEQRWSPLTRGSVKYTKADHATKRTDTPRHLVNDSQGNTSVLPLNGMPSDRNPHKMDGESFDWGPWDVPNTDFGDTKITDWAIERLQNDSDKPLFLGVGYYRPHIPLWAPKDFFERFKESPGKLPEVRNDDLDDLSETAKNWALEPVTAGSHSTTVRFNQWQAAVEAYLACISYVDFEIGRLLEALEKSDKSNNTIVVLWSDHGWHLGEKEHWGKWTPWERSTKVPMIIAPSKTDQAKFETGQACYQPVSLIDIFPTLLHYCNLNINNELEGKSLLPLLKEPAKVTDRKVLTLIDPGNVSLRDMNWRYIRYLDGNEELYNMLDDPNEWNNLARNNKFESVLSEFRTAIPDSEKNRKKSSGFNW